MNFAKALISFSRNVSEVAKAQISSELHIPLANDQFLYLGILVRVSRKKKEVFAYLKDWVWKRIQSWKDKSLSKGG